MLSSHHILFIITLITLTNCYAFEGNWSLTQLQNQPIAATANSTSVTLQVTDFIFNNSQIRQQLMFNIGCQQLILQASFAQNQLFIDYDNFTTNYNNKSSTCSTTQETQLLNQILQTITSVFYFEIYISFLQFLNPYGTPSMIFSRIAIKNNISFVGIWNIIQFGNTKTSLSLQISNNTMTFCQGNAIYNYTQNSKDKIKLSLVSNKGCSSSSLISAFQNSLYFRFRLGVVDLYDTNISLTIEMIYVQSYDPNNPIFPTITPTSSSPSKPPTSPSLTSSAISVANLKGNWQIISLFNIPFPTTPYSLVFNATDLQLIGGCNTFTYGYILYPNTQNIQLGPSRYTSQTCTKNDDQLYASGISKMYNYTLSSANEGIKLKFYDQGNVLAYDLILKTNNSSPNNTSSTSNVIPPNNPITLSTPAYSLSSGRYILLLLQRRDLPRILVNFTSNTLTYSICNTIQNLYILSNPNNLQSGNIKITGGPTSNNSCTSSNDQVYYGTLNLVSTFKVDQTSGVITFSNAGGIETISMTSA